MERTVEMLLISGKIFRESESAAQGTPETL